MTCCLAFSAAILFQISLGGLCLVSGVKVSIFTPEPRRWLFVVQLWRISLWVRSIGAELSKTATFRQEIKSLDPWLLVSPVPALNGLRWITDGERHHSWGCQQGPHSGRDNWHIEKKNKTIHSNFGCKSSVMTSSHHLGRQMSHLLGETWVYELALAKGITLPTLLLRGPTADCWATAHPWVLVRFALCAIPALVKHHSLPSERIVLWICNMFWFLRVTLGWLLPLEY